MRIEIKLVDFLCDHTGLLQREWLVLFRPAFDSSPPSAENRAGGRVAHRGRDWGSFTSSWAGYSPDKSPDPRRAVQNSRGVGGKGQPLRERQVCVRASERTRVLVWRGRKSILECACLSLPVCARHHQQALMCFTVIEKFLISLPLSIIVYESSPLRAQCMINSAQLMATLITPTVDFSGINFHKEYKFRGDCMVTAILK